MEINSYTDLDSHALSNDGHVSCRVTQSALMLQMQCEEILKQDLNRINWKDLMWGLYDEIHEGSCNGDAPVRSFIIKNWHDYETNWKLMADIIVSSFHLNNKHCIEYAISEDDFDPYLVVSDNGRFKVVDFQKEYFDSWKQHHTDFIKRMKEI